MTIPNVSSEATGPVVTVELSGAEGKKIVQLVIVT